MSRVVSVFEKPHQLCEMLGKSFSIDRLLVFLHFTCPPTIHHSKKILGESRGRLWGLRVAFVLNICTRRHRS